MTRSLLFAFSVLFLLAAPAIQAQQTRPGTDLGPTGWKLWLDRKAEWANDSFFLPPADLSKIPVNPPTCGWDQLFAKSLPEAQADQVVADPTLCLDVEVPGTVEEFYWNALSGPKGGLGKSGDYVGVSWWGRDFTVPAEAQGKRVKLFFSEGIRQRAEIYVNQKLVGYELVHQTPFDVDVTDAVQPGAANHLSVRITDPNGVFSWGDFHSLEWGNRLFPSAHGFGGILGTVVLRVMDSVHVTDVFVKNKPTLTDVDTDIEFTNEGSAEVKGTVDTEIVEVWQGGPVATPKTVFSKSAGPFDALPGQTAVVSASASVPDAKLWGIRDPNLYNFIVTLKDGQGHVIDRYTQRFGFRFLSVTGVGSDARYELNGKRTLLLSAISWGFWPINGIFPTSELARKHVESALALGQNMLNFHRCEGNSLVLNTADELGILYYEEPGAYISTRLKTDDPERMKTEDASVAIALNTQRLLRMVRRDRSHPSLVIYNMVNEPGLSPDDQAKQDMAAAHLADPTRTITYGSGFMQPENDQPQKLHMFPYDQTQYTTGFCDIHNAGNSPGVYTDTFYNSPTNFRRSERDSKEIFVWGEEGAIASPPQLAEIQDDYAKAGRPGWDGADYKEWYQTYSDYLHDKGLKKYFPSLTDLITSMGDIMYYEHGRLLENVRIADGADLNVLNGYEDMKLDNMSGAVDVFRNLKGHPKLISQYMRPLYVAVKARQKIGQTGDTNFFDLYVINEHSIPAGDYVVKARVEAPGTPGQSKEIFSGPVHVSGGDKFSDLVTEKVPVVLTGGKGYYKVTAELQDASGKKLADGHDEIFVVDWQSDQIGGKGAVLGGSSDLLKFIHDVKKADVVPYADDLAHLDYVVVGSIARGKDFQVIPSSNFLASDGKTLGLNLDYFRGRNFGEQIDQRVSTVPIDFDLKGKPIPGYDILGEANFSLRWQGFLVPSTSGPTQLQFAFSGGIRVWLDGNLIADSHGHKSPITVSEDLEAGKSYALKIEDTQDADAHWGISLLWKEPAQPALADLPTLLKRVHDDGTKLLIVDDAESWVTQLKELKALPEFKVFHPQKTWVGSNFFVRDHPFFQDLPVNQGMNWEYQRLVMYDGPKHFGLYGMTGEEAVVALVGGVTHVVATSVGIVPYGKGQIAFSSFDLIPHLFQDDGASNVPKKILCNYLKWAVGS